MDHYKYLYLLITSSIDIYNLTYTYIYSATLYNTAVHLFFNFTCYIVCTVAPGLVQVVLELVTPAGDVGQSALDTGLDNHGVVVHAVPGVKLSPQVLDLPGDV